MTRLVTACVLLVGLPFLAFAAGHTGFVGTWTATQGGQTIAWELRNDGTAIFHKGGAPQGELKWETTAEGAVVKAPPGDFVLTPEGEDMRIAPPPAIGAPAALFSRQD